MLFTNLEIQHSQEVVELFYDTFKASENESEAEIVSGLVKNFLQDYPREDLKGYVAMEDGEIMGSVFFSQLYFPNSNYKVFILSPMAVKTEYQGKGIGQALIRYAHAELVKADINLTMTYGDVNFYSKAGYQQISESQISPPMPLTYPEGWLANSLDGMTPLEMPGVPYCIAELQDENLW